jgi:hypothetical protein
MATNNYSGGRSKKDTSFNSSLTQTTFNNLKGISSNPIGQVAPDAFYSLINFMKDEYGRWVTRCGVNYVRYLTSVTRSAFSDFVEFTPSGATDSVGVIIQGEGAVKYSGTAFTNLNYSGDETFLVAGKGFGTAYNDNCYIVDGSQYIYKYNGTTTTRSAFAYASTYGNPVHVTNFVGRLWVATDKGFVFYSTFGSDDVFEDRYLLTGTASITAGTAAVTGTDTLFQSNQIEVGSELLLVSGGTSERVLVANVTSNTALTLSKNITNGFTNANVYLIGNQFFDYVGEDDGYLLRMMKPFGQFMAISKTSADNASSIGKLYVLRPTLAVDPLTGLPLGATLLNQIKSQANNINLHPYSFCEWNGNLLYLADSGIHLLQPSAFGDDTNLAPAINVSQGKLERHLDNALSSNRTKTRINRITTKGVNMLSLSMQFGATSGVDRNLLGFIDKENNFEFSEIRIRFNDVNGVGTSSPSGHIYPFRDYGLVCGDDGTATFYKDIYQTSDLVRLYYNTTCDQTTITCDDDQPTSDEIIEASLPIYKYFQTGTLHNDNWNRFDINKLMLTTNESKDEFDRTYSLNLLLDNIYRYSNITTAYQGGSETVTADNTTLDLADSTTGTSADETMILLDDPVYKTFFTNTKACRGVALEYTDVISYGVLRLLNYGYSIRLTRYD